MKFRLDNKIPLHLLQDLEVDTKFELDVEIPLSYYPYTISSHAASIIGRRGVKKESNLEFLIEHLKEDLGILERSIIKLQNSKDKHDYWWNSYNPLESIRIEEEFELYHKIKEKIGLPRHSTFRYEKVKCSKGCKPSHNHQYFYAYYSDPVTKKLKKIYIGKHLPLPIFISVSMKKEDCHSEEEACNLRYFFDFSLM